jgi:hypothetical protein
VIYAVEDEAKTFIRNFVIKDVSSGLAPATYYPEGHRPLVRFTADQPLTFARKLFPGLYEVRARR